MNLKQIDIRKIDSTGYFKLNEDYLLSYDHFDGWSERLLGLGIYIDLIFECKVDIHFRTWNRDNNSYEKQFGCEVPLEIKNIISELMNLDPLTLKYYYADMSMDDMSTQNFVINHGGVSHNVRIGILLKKPQPKNAAEKLFFDLLDLFEKWREEIYQECLKEIK